MKVEFAFQCGVKWDDMRGGDRVRHCDSCDHAVHDLSQMTKSEALAFLERTGGEACVSFMCDEDDGIITRPERAARGVRGKLSTMALTLPLLLAGCEQPNDPQPHAEATSPIEPAAPVRPSNSAESTTTPLPTEAFAAVGAAVRAADESAAVDCEHSEPHQTSDTMKRKKRRLAGKPRAVREVRVGGDVKPSGGPVIKLFDD